jgi:hypothetical protein
MNETDEPKVTDQPSWLDLPDKESYWTCFGNERTPPKISFWARIKKKFKNEPHKEPNLWRVLYYSKEDAEASASQPNEYWVWNKRPAKPELLSEAMFEARTKGDKGVAVLSFQEGEWKIVKRYPVDIPLPEELC